MGKEWEKEKEREERVKRGAGGERESSVSQGNTWIPQSPK